MGNRREFSIAVLAGFTAIAAGIGGSKAAGQLSEQQALKALDPWLDALVTGDPALVETVLAPEYQILRSDGSGHNKASYLNALPKHMVRPKFSDIVATGDGDVMVIRYRIETDQTVEGKAVTGISPRLSVFRMVNGRWLISAHANFAPLG
jgi:hypothetical protein